MITQNKLDFLSRRSNLQLDLDKGIVWNDFLVGTVHGKWTSTKEFYIILVIINEVPGNGHLNDVFQWFENSCKRDKKALVIKEFFNPQFKKHCLEKRGFKPLGNNDAIKTFK